MSISATTIPVFKKLYAAFRTLVIAGAVLQFGSSAALPQDREVAGPQILSLVEGEMPRGWSDRLSGASAQLPEFDPVGYRRPDFLPEVFAGRLENAPARGLDNMRYWATSVADLSAACPSLGVDQLSREALPYVFASAADLFKRFMSGNLSDSEMLQAGWMAILGINASNACRWDPSSGLSRDQAQAACNDAASARNDLGMFPSTDAEHDIALFLKRYSCSSPQAARLGEGLLDFGRAAAGRLVKSAGLPPESTAEGAAYQEILSNCARTAFSQKDITWCGCYIDTLYQLSPPRSMIDALALDPFASFSYTRSITGLAGGDSVFECTRSAYRSGDPREWYRDKTTACLISDDLRGDGLRDCVYRAGWGTFVVPDETCRPEYSSHHWGSEEVDCAAGGAPPAKSTGARRWKEGASTMIDWEQDVPDDFEPPFPDDARDNWPMEMRFLTRKATGQLTRQSIAELNEFLILGRFLMPNDPMADAFPGAFASLRSEGALVLTCNWTTGRGTTNQGFYWYQTEPDYIRSGSYPSVLDELFRPIGVGRESCPSRFPG